MLTRALSITQVYFFQTALPILGSWVLLASTFYCLFFSRHNSLSTFITDFGLDCSLPTLLLAACLPFPLRTTGSPPVRPLAGTNHISWIGISSDGSDPISCPLALYRGSIKGLRSFWKQSHPLLLPPVLMGRAHFLGWPNSSHRFPLARRQAGGSARAQGAHSLFRRGERKNIK